MFRHVPIGWVLLLQGKTEAALREMQQGKGEAWRLSGLLLVYPALGQPSESDRLMRGLIGDALQGVSEEDEVARVKV